MFILGGCILVRSQTFGSGSIDEFSSLLLRVVVVFGFVARRGVACVPRLVVVYGFVVKRGVCSCVCMYGLSVMCRADRVYTYRVQGDGDEHRGLLSGDGWSNFGNPEAFLE